MAVVIDKTRLAKFVHEMAYPRAGRAARFCGRLLTDLCDERLRPAFLAKVGQQKQQPGKPLFRGVKQLIEQVFLNSSISCQNMRHKYLGKYRLDADKPVNFSLSH